MRERLWNLIRPAHAKAAALPDFHAADVKGLIGDGAGIGRKDPGDQIEQCTFASAVRAQQPDDLAVSHGEIEFLYHPYTTETPRQPTNFEYRRCRWDWRGRHPTGDILPAVGISLAVVLSTLTRSRGNFLPFCHCPITNGVRQTFGNGPFLKLIGPTIEA